MSSCPDIDLWIDGEPSGDHELSCAACQSLSSLRKMRRGDSGLCGPDDQCARYEPYLGAMLEGTMRPGEVPGLCEHLALCASCSNIIASLTLMQSEWADVPDPRIELRGRDLMPQSRPAKGAGRVAARRFQAGVQIGLMVSAALALGVWLGRSPSRHESVPAAVLSVAASVPSNLASIAVTPPFPWPLPSQEPSQQPASTSRPPPLAASGKGAVSILCQPLCDSVLIDGKNVGPSPVIRREVAAGERRITLKRGTQSRVSVLNVKDGELSQLRVKMDEDIAAEPGFLTVVCSPFCDEVLVDGKNLGPSPLVHSPVSQGIHSLTLKRASVVKDLSVTVKSGEVTSYRVSMAP